MTCPLCNDYSEVVVRPERLLGATYFNGGSGDEYLEPCPICCGKRITFHQVVANLMLNIDKDLMKWYVNNRDKDPYPNIMSYLASGVLGYYIPMSMARSTMRQYIIQLREMDKHGKL